MRPLTGLCVRARLGPLPADAPEHPCAQCVPRGTLGAGRGYAWTGGVDDRPLRLAPPAASGLAVPWVCPGCANLVVNPPPPCPAQQVAAGWGSPEAGAPRAGAGEDLGGPLGGGGWENPLQAPACVEATEAQGFLPPAEQGGAGPAPPIPRPQAAVSLWVAVSLPHSLPSLCVQRGCTVLGAGGVGLMKRGAELGFTQAQTCLHHRVLGPR